MGLSLRRLLEGLGLRRVRLTTSASSFSFERAELGLQTLDRTLVLGVRRLDHANVHAPSFSRLDDWKSAASSWLQLAEGGHGGENLVARVASAAPACWDVSTPE